MPSSWNPSSRYDKTDTVAMIDNITQFNNTLKNVKNLQGFMRLYPQWSHNVMMNNQIKS